jgi:hypothetical protein
MSFVHSDGKLMDEVVAVQHGDQQSILWRLALVTSGPALEIVVLAAFANPIAILVPSS